MGDPAEGPQDDTLAEQAQKQNSSMQRLIEAIVTLVAASRELMARLQPQTNTPPSDNPPGTP